MVDLRHFAFYAFAGRSGQLRWSRKKEVCPLLILNAAITAGTFVIL